MTPEDSLRAYEMFEALRTCECALRALAAHCDSSGIDPRFELRSCTWRAKDTEIHTLLGSRAGTERHAGTLCRYGCCCRYSSRYDHKGINSEPPHTAAYRHQMRKGA